MGTKVRKSTERASAGSKSGRTRTRSALTGTFVTGKRSPEPDAEVVFFEVDHEVSATQLHQRTRPTLDLLRTSDAVAVTHYNEVEGYLVSADSFLELVGHVQRALAREAELDTTLPLLLAAAQTRVPIPSESLTRLMPNTDVAERWREIAEFAAAFPVRISAGEHGEPITRASLSHVSGYVNETGSDDDLDLG